jgi:hypothetical protein
MSITIRHSQGQLLPGVNPGDLLAWSRPRPTS